MARKRCGSRICGSWNLLFIRAADLEEKSVSHQKSLRPLFFSVSSYLIGIVHASTEPRNLIPTDYAERKACCYYGQQRRVRRLARDCRNHERCELHERDPQRHTIPQAHKEALHP